VPLPVLRRAASSTLDAVRRFATGLYDDYQAVKAGVTLPWSTSPVEGHINRLKMLKRQMVWSRAPRSPRALLPAGATGAGSPGRRAAGASPGPGRRAGRVAHAYDSGGVICTPAASPWLQGRPESVLSNVIQGWQPGACRTHATSRRGGHRLHKILLFQLSPK
jgi:hypothetical protein